jgi:hypothetical protein
VSNYASCRVTSASIPRTIVSPIHQRLSLSLPFPGCLAAAASHQHCHLKQDYWCGGASILHGLPLPCAIGSVGRKPCGQGSPLVRPDGAGQSGKVVDEEDDDDDEQDNSSSSDRWVSGSGSPGSFCLASWGPLGFWRLWSPLQGTAVGVLGRPLFLQACP